MSFDLFRTQNQTERANTLSPEFFHINNIEHGGLLRAQNQQAQSDRSTDARLGLPQVEIADGRRPAGFQAEFGADGQLQRFTDNRGQTFRRDGDHFVDSNNPLRPQGVNITVDRTTNTASIVDRQTGIRTTLTQNNVETVDYASVHGGRVTRRVDGDKEYMSIESVNRPLRMMTLVHNAEGAMVSEYTDEGMHKYTLNNRRDGEGHPLYDAVDRNGQSIGNNFTITADRSGNVVVRNLDRPNAADFAVRELNNGTIVSSAANDSMRRVVTADGRSLVPDSEEGYRAQESPLLQEVPPRANLTADTDDAFRNFVGSGLFMDPFSAHDWFAANMRTNQRWDFKQAGQGNNVMNMEYEDYGNWHYGYIGTAAGIDPTLLEMRAGQYQIDSRTSRPGWGTAPWDGGLTGLVGTWPYGDDPHDNEMIRRGIADRQTQVAREQEDARRSMMRA